MKNPKVGSKMKVWFGDAKILKVNKYTGAYPQWFRWVVRLSADTPRGYVEMAI